MYVKVCGNMQVSQGERSKDEERKQTKGNFSEVEHIFFVLYVFLLGFVDGFVLLVVVVVVVVSVCVVVVDLCCSSLPNNSTSPPFLFHSLTPQ